MTEGELTPFINKYLKQSYSNNLKLIWKGKDIRVVKAILKEKESYTVISRITLKL